MQRRWVKRRYPLSTVVPLSPRSNEGLEGTPASVAPANRLLPEARPLRRERQSRQACPAGRFAGRGRDGTRLASDETRGTRSARTVAQSAPGDPNREQPGRFGGPPNPSVARRNVIHPKRLPDLDATTAWTVFFGRWGNRGTQPAHPATGSPASHFTRNRNQAAIQSIGPLTPILRMVLTTQFQTAKPCSPSSGQAIALRGAPSPGCLRHSQPICYNRILGTC